MKIPPITIIMPLCVPSTLSDQLTAAIIKTKYETNSDSVASCCNALLTPARVSQQARNPAMQISDTTKVFFDSATYLHDAARHAFTSGNVKIHSLLILYGLW